jgi:glycogen(starch) synthase
VKIALITYEYPPHRGKGGIATYMKQVAQLLAKNNLVIHVFSSIDGEALCEESDNVIIHWISSHCPEDFRHKVVPEFKRVNSLVEFDFIESPEINANASKIKEEFPEIPLIVRIHAPNVIVEKAKLFYTPFLVKLRFFMGAIKRGRIDLGYWARYEKNNDLDYKFVCSADIVTAPSIWMQNWVVENWKIRNLNVYVFPNLYVPTRELLDIPIAKGHPHKTILFYGRLNVLKGCVNLARCMRAILNEYLDWNFRIVGDDGPGPYPYSKGMKQWIIDHLGHLSERVEFNDGVSYDNMHLYFENCEIVLIPSLFESFSYVCMESMAAGKAIVGSNVGGMSEIIKNHQTGLLINPHSVNEIIDTVCSLIKDADYCFCLSENARKDIINQSHEDIIVDFYTRDITTLK